MSAVSIFGYDEVGWGSIAGPLVVAGVIMPENEAISSVTKDSKKFNSEALRKAAYNHITLNYPYDWVFVHPGECVNWGEALRFAMTSLVNSMIDKFPQNEKSKMIVDGNVTHGIQNLIAIPKADALIPAVAAASIVAKVLHDEYMINIQKVCPVDYGWERNKGYGTPEHIKALNQYGPIRGVHRENIDKVKKALKSKGWYK